MKRPFVVSIIFLTLIVAAASLPPSRKKQRIALGEKLFNEKMLSKDSSVSCASCHKPDFAFADTVAFSVGIGGRLTTRNTPSVLNMKNRPYYFWDGRAATLEEQALIPLQNPDEMGLSIPEALKRLNESDEYRKLFYKVFRQNPNEKNLASAFAAYEQTLETVDSKFDDWSNNKIELSESEERGRQLFVGSKAKCFECHLMEDFTDDSFKNIGLFDGKDLNDAGRFLITGDSADLGKFKTPGLRNVAVTGPYMHNGMFNTLHQVLAYYNAPGHFVDNPLNIDSSLAAPLGLTPGERKDIVAFLETLTDRKHAKKTSEKK